MAYRSGVEVKDAAPRRRRHLDLLPARAEQRVQVVVGVAPERPGAVLAAPVHRVDDGDPQVPDTVPVQRGEQQRRGAAATEQREVDVERRGARSPAPRCHTAARHRGCGRHGAQATGAGYSTGVGSA